MVVAQMCQQCIFSTGGCVKGSQNLINVKLVICLVAQPSASTLVAGSGRQDGEI